MPDTGSGIIYHYCSLEAFKSIIENKCLWLCDVQKSNDSTERVYFENIMLDQIDHYSEVLKGKNDVDKERALQALQLVKEALQNPETERAPVYSCSFSYNGDQLSQWRGYADDGYGVAIGFNAEILKQQLPFENFGRISYDYEQAKKNCWNILQTSFSYCNGSDPIQYGPDYCSLFGMNVLSELERNNIFFKSNAFAEEQEFRIAVCINSHCFSTSRYQLHTPASIRIKLSDMASNFNVSTEKFRVAQHKLSSYLELSFEKIKDHFVTVIRLGPKCLAEAKDIRYFLKCNNYKVGGIKIKHSAATYR